MPSLRRRTRQAGSRAIWPCSPSPASARTVPRGSSRSAGASALCSLGCHRSPAFSSYRLWVGPAWVGARAGDTTISPSTSPRERQRSVRGHSESLSVRPAQGPAARPAIPAARAAGAGAQGRRALGAPSGALCNVS